MTWAPVDKPPDGWVPSVLREGDTLASLESETGKTASDIASANGVRWPGFKSCAWSREVGEWVLATGGKLIASDENPCDSRGFASFVGGQVIYLPAGVRPAPGVVAVAQAKRWPLYVLGALGVLAAVAATRR